MLGDPEKRRKYDELGANWRMYEQAQQQGQGFLERLACLPPAWVGANGYRYYDAAQVEAVVDAICHAAERAAGKCR